MCRRAAADLSPSGVRLGRTVPAARGGVAARAAYPRRRDPAGRPPRPARPRRRRAVRRRPRGAWSRPSCAPAAFATRACSRPWPPCRARRSCPVGLRDLAYADEALPIEHGQTISQPLMVGLMTQLLAPEPGERVLEIGHGIRLPGRRARGDGLPGDQRRARCRSWPRRPASAWRALGYGDRWRSGSATGAPASPATAPWPRILVAAAAPRVPDALTAQLADGGRLVIPVGPRYEQELVLVERDGGRLRTTNHGACVFVPLVGEGGFRLTAARGGSPGLIGHVVSAGAIRSVYSPGHDPCLRRPPPRRRRALLRRADREPARARPERHDPHGLLRQRRGRRPDASTSARRSASGTRRSGRRPRRSTARTSPPTSRWTRAERALPRGAGPARRHPGRGRRGRQALLAALVVVSPRRHPQPAAWPGSR